MPYRRRTRSSRTSAPVQSFKKILNFAPASHAAATTINRVLVTGVDSVAAGQTSPTDSQVPTGSVIKQIEIQFAAQNLVNIAAFLHVCIQHLRTGQAALAPNVIGGNAQRNQVFYQDLKSVGQNQNVNMKLRFKIPKKFGRVREGDTWNFTHLTDQIVTDAVQVIYKFYR